MIFLGKDEARLLEKKLRHDLAEYGDPKHVLYYDSSPRDHSIPASAIARSTGTFSAATVLYLFSVRSGWDEHSEGVEGWQRYRRWRQAKGEDRPLYDAPGHRFGPDEIELLSETIAFAFELGWDALLALNPGRKLLLLSHDDRVEIYRGFSGELVRQLAALDQWQRAERKPQRR